MKSFKRKIFFLFLIIILSNLKTSYGQPNQFTGNNIKSGDWAFCKIDDTTASIRDIVKKYYNGQFTPIKKGMLNAGIAKQCYWIHFNITNTSADVNNLIIDVDNSRLNKLELFELSKDTIQSLGKLGDLYPFHQRPVLNKTFLYQVFLMSDQKKEFFLSVNQVGNTFILPVKIYNSKNFNSNTFKDYLLDGVTYGILLFVAIMSLLFFITSRHILYFYYGLYVVTAIAWFLSYFGLGFQYFWPNHPPLNTSISPLMAVMNILLNLQICQILLRLPKVNRPLNSLVNYTKLLLTLAGLFPFVIDLNSYGYTLNHTYLIILLCSILFAMLILSYGVIIYAFKGLLAAKLYLVASILKALSIVNMALLELGIMPAFYNIEGFMQAGIFIEIALLTYALASRYTNYKMKTFERVIEAQEQERFLILKEIHDGISSSLTGINMGITNFTRDVEYLSPDRRAQLDKIFDELNKVSVEAKSISHNTMPDYIKDNAISEIVERHMEEIKNKIKNNSDGKEFIRINFSANKQLVNFSEALKLNVFRIVQEILINILKHSKAANADILFSFSKRELLIIAEDDGVGFEQSFDEDNNGMGIKNIKSRVELLEGNITIKSPTHTREQDVSSDIITSAIHYGTMIKITIPYRNNLLKIAGHDY